MSLLIVAAALAGCPAPPPDPGPPPSPVDAAGIVYPDTSDERPAPVLPDPRSMLPPVEQAAAPTRETVPVSPEVVAAGPAYSVQVFASEMRENAEEVARRLDAGLLEPVEVVRESDGMWRVYAGNDAARAPIDALRDRLRARGFAEAWTKNRGTPDAADSLEPPESAGPVYTVQVFASDNEAGASRVADAVRRRTPMPVAVERHGDLWKVYVGSSTNRDAIDGERDRLRASGYPDAWTVQR